MLSIIIYTIGFLYVLFGIYAILLHKRGTINRLFLLITISLAIWSFSYSIALAAHTAEESIFWRCVTVFGWGIIYSIVLHFVLVLGESRLLNKRITFVVIYLPAIINVILYAPFGLFGPKQYKMVQTEFGWLNTFPTTIDGYWLFLYYIVFGVVSIILLFRWLGKVESNTFLKKDVLKFKLSFYLTVILGLVTDILPDILGIKVFPKIAVIILFIPTIATFTALKRFGLFLEREKTAPEFLTYGRLMPNDRLALFRIVGFIFITGSDISFLIRFFIMRGSLKIEILLSLIPLFMGILTMLIPIFTKNQAIQNTVFLLLSAAGTIFYSLMCFNTGAITVWAIYTLFFLFTVILGSKAHSVIFAVVSIVIQIMFFITQPEVVVTVGRTDYVSRIAIIVLTFVITQFLMSLQTVRMQKYEKSTKEQSLLERISSSFISYNKEDSEEKLNEMFKMSAEILNFDYAYLLEISPDYENVTYVSTYVNCEKADNAFPDYSEMEANDMILPMIESLRTNKQPIVCDDVANISIREHETARNYCMSKGIKSFSALPVIIDERIHGILVVEYLSRTDKHTWENRLSVLKILTNVLADARKKLLYEERLHEFAYFDAATKMANLNMLTNTLESILQNGEDSNKIAILDIEIENLKLINDTFGHAIGEQIIIKSASILENLFQDSIIISRTGEKEFIVVLPYCDNKDEIKNRAREVINNFSRPLLTETGVEALFVIVNIGISLYPQDGKDVDALLESAELAGNEAEHSESKIVFYTSRIKEHITETTLLTNRLFRSLQNNEFYLEYQPQINLATGKTVGVESLLRLTSEDDKIVEPSRFIPILETTGSIYDVGYWVLKQSILAHQRLVMKGFPPLRFSINVSAVQFQRYDFMDAVSKIIEENQIDPQYIEFELTESALVGNLSDTIEKVTGLKKLGVSVAIDDFGKGYSSLHRLEAIPFDRIKIDKSITDNINSEKKQTIVTETVILLAKAFRAYTTAEGVETKNQVDFLKNLGYHEAQGYYFSQPLSIDELEEFLRNEI
ncbi:MAG: EAL domain-containing protein [Saccharofermentanales bacterium]|jgi:diguanylate cyclase (GGDEF)-like protein